jgi:hypothetical protein
MRRWCSYIALSALAGAAMAGSPPPVFVMSSPPTAGQYAQLDPDYRRTMVANLAVDLYNWGGTATMKGDEAAQHLASEIVRRRAMIDPPLPDGMICVWLGNFGLDSDLCDEGGRFHASTLRYFTEADRIAGITDLDFPEPRNDQSGADFRTARAYRHPFLHNAGVNGPLRAWMLEFVEEYKALQMQNNTDSNGSLPVSRAASSTRTTPARVVNVSRWGGTTRTPCSPTGSSSRRCDGWPSSPARARGSACSCTA